MLYRHADSIFIYLFIYLFILRSVLGFGHRPSHLLRLYYLSHTLTLFDLAIFARGSHVYAWSA
jgi:hypothetical protein